MLGFLSALFPSERKEQDDDDDDDDLSADIICSGKQTVFRERSSRTIRAYFRAKWRLLCLLSFKHFLQHAQF